MDHRGRRTPAHPLTASARRLRIRYSTTDSSEDQAQQDHGHGLRIAHLEEPERGHVDVGGDRLGRMRGSALGHHPDHVEDPQRPDRGQQDQRERLRPEQRPRDVPEPLEPARALEERVFVVLARDGLDRRQVHDHAEPGEPPQERDHDRPQRDVRDPRAVRRSACSIPSAPPSVGTIPKNGANRNFQTVPTATGASTKGAKNTNTNTVRPRRTPRDEHRQQQVRTPSGARPPRR